MPVILEYREDDVEHSLAITTRHAAIPNARPVTLISDQNAISEEISGCDSNVVDQHQIAEFRIRACIASRWVLSALLPCFVNMYQLTGRRFSNFLSMST